MGVGRSTQPFYVLGESVQNSKFTTKYHGLLEKIPECITLNP